MSDPADWWKDEPERDPLTDRLEAMARLIEMDRVMRVAIDPSFAEYVFPVSDTEE